MRAKTILTVLFLLSIGVAAAIFMRAMSVQLQAGATGPEALVAAAPLLPGTLLRAEDVAWHPLAPTGYAGAILRPDEAQRKDHPAIDEQTRADVYGAALRVELAAGDPIRSEVIVKPGDRDFLRVVLTPGLRAISIPVKTGGAGAGMLDPGDRVDVILTQRFEDKNGTMVRRSVAETVVEDLRVLAIDAASGKGSVGQNDGFGRTVTLEVTPPQAQKINVASELGKLSLTLRPTDTTIAGAPPASGPAATWAGDVSPALGSMLLPPEKNVVDPSVEVMRGDKAGVKVKPR